jgi:hypothetical protein
MHLIVPVIRYVVDIIMVLWMAFVFAVGRPIKKVS